MNIDNRLKFGDICMSEAIRGLENQKLPLEQSMRAVKMAIEAREACKVKVPSEQIMRAVKMAIEAREACKAKVPSEQIMRAVKMAIEAREACKAKVPLEQIMRAVKMAIGNLESMPYSINGLVENLRDIKYDKLKFNEDGTITYLDETVSVQDVVSEFNECIESKGNWQQRLYNLYKIKKEKSPITVHLIIFIVINLIIGPFHELYLDKTKVIAENRINSIQTSSKISNDKNKIIKDIKKEVLKEVYINNQENEMIKISLNQYRFVAVDCLNVRVNSSNGSRVIYNLKLGQVVKIIRKDKNWTLVEYAEGDDMLIKGWVYTRYISQFK